MVFFGHPYLMTPWPSWLRRATVNRKIVSSILTGVALVFYFFGCLSLYKLVLKALISSFILLLFIQRTPCLCNSYYSNWDPKQYIDFGKVLIVPENQNEQCMPFSLQICFLLLFATQFLICIFERFVFCARYCWLLWSRYGLSIWLRYQVSSICTFSLVKRWPR